MADYILIAEDDLDSRQLIADLLEILGYAIRMADNGQVALDMALAEKPRLLLLDVAMPVKSGLDVTRQIRAHYGSEAPPIFLMSAYGQRTDVEDGLLAGANDYLTKPFSPVELLDKVRAAMERPPD